MANNELMIGMPSPDFSLDATEGKKISLKDFKGKIVILYFYPKDDTPGCTKEACGFRDTFDELKKLNAVVLGVSKDTIESHKKFQEKYHFDFPLLSDPNGTMIDTYGGVNGKIPRSTFVIDHEGIIRRIWPKVDLERHIEEVVEVVKLLRGQEARHALNITPGCAT